jgi:outer membrane protein assembly factor BamB
MRHTLAIGITVLAVTTMGAVTLGATGVAASEPTTSAGDVSTPAWRAAVGTDGASSPAYADGRLFVGTDTGLVGLDPATGAVIVHYRSAPVSTTPAVIRGVDPQPDPPGQVIFGSRDGILHAVSTSGEPLWQASLGAAPTSPLVLQSPGAPSSRIVVGAGNRLFALDADGRRLWSTVLEGGDISKSAIFASQAERPTLIVSAGDRLYTLDAETGAVLASDASECGTLGAPSAGPPGASGDMYALFGSDCGKLFAVDPRLGAPRTIFTARAAISAAPAIGDPDSTGPKVVLGDRDGNIYAFDQTDESPAPIWQTALDGPLGGPPVLAGGVVYAATDPLDGNPHLAALDAASGRPLFDAPLPAGSAASPTVADGRLIVATRGGDVLAYDGPDS